jgi:hypothetical protein
VGRTRGDGIMDSLLDDIEEVLKRHSSSFEIMSVDGDEDGLTFTVSAEYLKKEVDFFAD